MKWARTVPRPYDGNEKKTGLKRCSTPTKTIKLSPSFDSFDELMINNSGQVANYVKSVKIICFFSVFHDYVDKSVNEKDFGVKKSRPYKNDRQAVSPLQIYLNFNLDRKRRLRTEVRRDMGLPDN